MHLSIIILYTDTTTQELVFLEIRETKSRLT